MYEKLISRVHSTEFCPKEFVKAIQNLDNCDQLIIELKESFKNIENEISKFICHNNETLINQTLAADQVHTSVDTIRNKLISLSVLITEVKNYADDKEKRLIILLNQMKCIHECLEILRSLRKLNIIMKQVQENNFTLKSADLLNEFKRIISSDKISKINQITNYKDFCDSQKSANLQDAHSQMTLNLRESNIKELSITLYRIHLIGESCKFVREFTSHYKNSFEELLKTYDPDKMLKLIRKNEKKQENVGSGPGMASLNKNASEASDFHQKVWSQLDECLTEIINSSKLFKALGSAMTAKNQFCSLKYRDIELIQLVKENYPDDFILHDDLAFIEGSAEYYSMNNKSFLFWSLEKLILAIKENCKKSPQMRNIFENQYPKFAKIFENFTKTLCESETLRDQLAPWEMKLNGFLNLIESAYLSKCLAKLHDMINASFSYSSSEIPQKIQICNFIDRAREEFLFVGDNENLKEKIIVKVISKSLTIFTSKIESLANFDATSSRLIGTISSSQILNSKLIFLLIEFETMFHNSVIKQFASESKSYSCIQEICQEKVRGLIKTILHPFLNNVQDTINDKVSDLHKANLSRINMNQCLNDLNEIFRNNFKEKISLLYNDYWKNSNYPNNGEPLSLSKNSLCMIRKILRDYLSKAITTFILHASLIRPMDENGRCALSAICAEFELFLVNNFLSLPTEEPGLDSLSDLCSEESLNLKAFRPLMFASLGTIAKTFQVDPIENDEESEHVEVLKNIPLSILLHHLYSRASDELKSVHVAVNWSIDRYSKWYLSCNSENDRLQLIQKSLLIYEREVNERQQTFFTPVYTLIKDLLEKSKNSI